MAFIWVQQWVALPIIAEGPMGDTTSNPPNQTPEHDVYLHDDKSRAPAGSGVPDVSPYHQFSGAAQQLRQDASRHQANLGSYPVQSHQPQSNSFNLGSMASALPDFAATQQAQRVQGGAQSSVRGLHYSSASPYGGNFASGQFPGTSIDTSLDGLTGQQPQRHGNLGTAPSPYSPYGQQLPQYYYPNTQFNPSGQHSFFTGAGQNVPAYDRRTTAGALQNIQPNYAGNYQNQGLGRTIQGLGGYGDLFTTGEGRHTDNIGALEFAKANVVVSSSSTTSICRQCKLCTTRSATKAQTVRSCIVGW